MTQMTPSVPSWVLWAHGNSPLVHTNSSPAMTSKVPGLGLGQCPDSNQRDSVVSG